MARSTARPPARRETTSGTCVCSAYHRIGGPANAARLATRPVDALIHSLDGGFSVRVETAASTSKGGSDELLAHAAPRSHGRASARAHDRGIVRTGSREGAEGIWRLRGPGVPLLQLRLSETEVCQGLPRVVWPSEQDVRLLCEAGPEGAEGRLRADKVRRARRLHRRVVQKTGEDGLPRLHTADQKPGGRLEGDVSPGHYPVRRLLPTEPARELHERLQ